jgi:DNA-binding response OmpR family regulator
MGITVDAERRVIIRHGKAVMLSAKQFVAFMTLYDRRGRVVCDDFLKSAVWGDDTPLYQTFHAFLSSLRSKLIPLWLRIECQTEFGHELVVARKGERFSSTRRQAKEAA